MNNATVVSLLHNVLGITLSACEGMICLDEFTYYHFTDLLVPIAPGAGWLVAWLLNVPATC